MRELARWRADDGSSGSWRPGGDVFFRAGVSGAWERVGHAKQHKRAVQLLQARRLGWRLLGSVSVADSSYRMSTRHRTTGRSRAETDFLFREPGHHESTPIRLGRMAAWFLRRERQQCREDVAQTGQWYPQTQETLFDEPLTLGEVLAAIEDERAPLSDDERNAARQALLDVTLTDPGEDESDDDETDDDDERLAG